MREGLLQEDKILELGKGKASEKTKMLNENRTKALQKKLRKKLLEDTLERQQEFMAEKLLKKATLNIEEEANIFEILENDKKMNMFNEEEKYRKTANEGGLLQNDETRMGYAAGEKVGPPIAKDVFNELPESLKNGWKVVSLEDRDYIIPNNKTKEDLENMNTDFGYAKNYLRDLDKKIKKLEKKQKTNKNLNTIQKGVNFYNSIHNALVPGPMTESSKKSYGPTNLDLTDKEKQMIKDYNKRDSKKMGGLLQDDEERYGMKDGGPGIEALREEAPEVVERMGFQDGGGDLLNKRLEATINEETKYAKEYGDDYFKKGTGLFGRLGRSLGDSGEGLRAFTEMRKANNQLGDKYTNEQLTTMLNQGYSDKGLEYKFTLPEKFKSERKQKAEGGLLLTDDMETPMMPEEMPEMESDSDMEENYTRFIMDEALSEEEEDMLVSKLEQDEELQMLFDKVIDVAQEFAGNGPVEGPGTGVSDDIPARLSDGEFVFTAKAVEEIGEDTLMSMMKDAEVAADERQGLAMGGTTDEVEKPNTNVQGILMQDATGVAEDLRERAISGDKRYIQS